LLVDLVDGSGRNEPERNVSSISTRLSSGCERNANVIVLQSPFARATTQGVSYEPFGLGRFEDQPQLSSVFERPGKQLR